MKSWFSTIAKITIIVFTFAIYLSFAPSAYAGADHNVFGSAWSDNIGWISFNSCTNPSPNFVGSTCGTYGYGVLLDKTTLEVSGTAWNNNVGWISFDPSKWGGCPPGMSSCGSFVNKWKSGGWARVVSAKSGANTGGFDGWISLGGSTYEAPFDMTVDISASMPADYADNTIFRINTSTNGYWWGSEVVGWIDLNPTSSLDPSKGGVFLIDLSTDTLELTSNATNNTVVAGYNVDIHWKTNGFIPTECTGTMFDSKGTPILNGDWNQKFNYSGGLTEEDIKNIEVPADYPNNASKIATKYTLLCKNSVKKAAQTITIFAEPLTVFLKSAQSCFSGTTSTLDWFTNDTSQSCSIEAVTAPGGSGTYTVPVTGQSPGSADDTNFSANIGNGATKYSLTCENGAGRAYQNPIKAKTVGTVAINQCTADYSVSYSPSCQPFNLNPTNYEATVELGVNSVYGFNSNVTVSDGGGLGTWAFAPGDTISSPYVSKINATLTLTKSEYNSIDWNNKFFSDLFFDGGGLSTKTKPIEFCESGTKKVKPKYVPF